MALVFAYLFLALAFIGILLPGLPTVPFLLLAAWFAAKGSERLHSWLYQHPRFGKMLIDWETERAVSRASKTIALVMLAGSWIFMFYRLDSLWLLGLITMVFVIVGTFLMTRPEPKLNKTKG